MGQYLTPGHVYVDGSTVTGPNLTEHVDEASFNTTAITEQTVNPTPALTDQLLSVASDAFFQTTIQQIHDLILYPGCVVQTKYGEYTANTNLMTAIPSDDTIPQNTEGTEILSVSITPRFATSTILARWQGQWSISNINAFLASLFRDSGVNAIASVFQYCDIASAYRQSSIEHMDSPATTSPIAYKIRVGPALAGILRMNGNSAQRFLGGVMKSTLVLQEIKS